VLGNGFAIACLNDKRAIDQFVSPIAVKLFHDDRVRERYERACGSEPAAEFIISLDLRLQVKDVHDPPASRLFRGEREQAARLGQPVCPHRRALIDIGLEPQWCVEQAGAKNSFDMVRPLSQPGKLQFHGRVSKARTRLPG
jgi:hypothetical protein